MIEFKGRSESIFVTTVVFLCISLAAVCMRCFVRLRVLKAFGWDDGLMVFAMVCPWHTGESYAIRILTDKLQAANILFAICGIMGSLYGMGQTFEELDPTKIKTALFVSGQPK